MSLQQILNGPRGAEIGAMLENYAISASWGTNNGIQEGIFAFATLVSGGELFELVESIGSISLRLGSKVAAEGAELAAKEGGRVFWSGGNVAKNADADFAAANGMKTLEMTTIGKIMNFISPYLPKSISRPIWNSLSSNFAKGASGNINVFQNAAGVGLNSTWRMVEYPILENQNIIYHIVK